MDLSLDLNRRYTYADYLTWLDDIRRELFDGFIRLMAAPQDVHVEVSGNVYGNLWTLLSKNKGTCKVRSAPFDVRLPENGEKDNDKVFTVVQPDVCVICDTTKLDKNGCIGAPDLIVEVLSPSTSKKDWKEKFYLYEKHGVREYWIVHPVDKIITVFLLKPDGKYDEGVLYESGQVPVTIFNVTLEISDIFT